MNWQKIKLNFKKYGVPALIIVVVVASALRIVSAEPAQDEIAAPLPTVNTISLDSQSSDSRIVATGVIKSENQVTLRSEVNAPVDTVLARVGDTVVAGAPILEFRHDDFSAQLAQAAAGVAAVQAQIAIQTAPPRAEDIRRAELAVEQAVVGVDRALAERERILVANAKLIQDTQDAVDQMYRTAYLSAVASSSALRDALVTISDFQQLYFNCSDQQICFRIEESKADAIFTAYGTLNAGRWSSASVQNIKTGIVADLNSMTVDTIDPVLLRSVLTRLQEALLSTRTGLDFVRQGFDSYPPATSATPAERAAAEGARAGVDGTVASIDGQLRAFQVTQGGLVGGSPRTVEDARIAADQNRRLANTAIESAETALETARVNLVQLLAGPRDIDMGPLYAQLAQANAAYSLALSSERRYFVNAPFTGEIISINARVGESIAPGQVIVTIANPQALEVSVFVSPEDRRAISRHAAVRVNGEASGVITAISSGIDAETGKIEIRVAIIDNANSMLVGEYVTIAFEREAETGAGMQVPLSAIKTTPEGSFAFSISDEQKLIPHRVTTGAVTGDRITVTFDGAEPARIVENARGLRAGDEVNTR